MSEDSRIDVSYNGYLPGHTSGNTTNGASTGTSGGSYGGLGGGLGVPNAIYGDYADPEDWGSGGSTGSRSPGGGLVRITANVFVLGGMLLADGAEGSSPLATVNSGGSGGGIWGRFVASETP